MYNAVICRYHEIAIKGNNRKEFERQLMGNMRYLLRVAGANCKVRQVRGRVWLEHPDKTQLFTPEELAVVRGVLEKIFGLESFSPARLLPSTMEDIYAILGEMLEGAFAPLMAKKDVVSFAIRARRSNKQFPLHSKDIEIALATQVFTTLDDSKLKVDLENPDITIGCEVRHEFTALFVETFKAPGGLPVGSNGRVLGLLSGGIDSPAAAYMAMKRGCAVDFITFHSAPYTPPESVDKVVRLAELLNTYQYPGKLHICNLAPLQKLIRDLCTERMRTVLYRRAMMRIAAIVAEKSKCGALLTGEAVGQVASQTIKNMSTIDASTEMLILRPLCGADKQDSIRLAVQMGTYDISIIPAPDSCTVFAPDSPATSVPRHIAESEEAKIPDYDNIIKELADSVETVTPGMKIFPKEPVSKVMEMRFENEHRSNCRSSVEGATRRVTPDTALQQVGDERFKARFQDF